MMTVSRAKLLYSPRFQGKGDCDYSSSIDDFCRILQSFTGKIIIMKIILCIAALSYTVVGKLH